MEFLGNQLDLSRTLALICEVKTGRYDQAELFRTENLRYAIGRLGLVPIERVEDITQQLKTSGTIRINGTVLISKLLVGNVQKNAHDYMFVSFRHIRRFLRRRVRHYPIQKFRDRMFFGSVLFQELIDQVALDDNQGG